MNIICKCNEYALTEKKNYIGFEVLTAVNIKSSIFWHIMLSSPVKVNRLLEKHISSISRVEE
jgi:hypothetical protein